MNFVEPIIGENLESNRFVAQNKERKVKLLCTLGPPSFNAKVIQRLDEFGASLFRINLSHTEAKDLPKLIELIRSYTDVPICLDTEGAQVRTGSFSQPYFEVPDNAVVRIHNKRVPGTPWDWNLYPQGVVNDLVVGDILSIDFNMVLIQIIAKKSDFIEARVITGGKVGRNKAVTVKRDIKMDCLTEKDKAAIKIGQELGIKHFALSFANTGDDVSEIRKRTGDDAYIVSKIECLNGLAHFDDIASKSDAILIDRGDLSRQVPLEHMPRAQKQILSRAKELGTEAFVATNLLESMVSEAEPTRAEVNDIYNTLSDGADGLVLAAETAIGKYPLQCASMIKQVANSYLSQTNLYDQDGLSVYQDIALTNLIEPHGGQLVSQEWSDNKPIDTFHRLVVDTETLLDAQCIANGTFSPLEGFMDFETVSNVISNMKTLDGHLWTLPIILQLRKDQPVPNADEPVVLCDAENNPLFVLQSDSTFDLDMETYAKGVFGTADPAHPGVSKLFAKSPTCLSGKVYRINDVDIEMGELAFSPHISRYIFAKKGWTKIVGFHTRNAPHRAHETIQFSAMKKVNADGLFLTPVIGPKKKGDMLSKPILDAYQTLLDFGIYPQDQVLLGAFAAYPRYAGPREAVFTAICRKNMGCSHFVIGRDHTGVGNFYEADANQKIFDAAEGSLGIKPLFFDEVAFDPKSNSYGYHDALYNQRISGTDIRNKICEGQELEEWIVRPVVADVLFDAFNSKSGLFF